MFFWGMILLGLDLALMGAIIYIFYSKKGFDPGFAAVAGDAAGLRQELMSIKKMAAQLERKKGEIETFERSIKEKSSILDEVIKNAESAVKKQAVAAPQAAFAAAPGTGEDVYRKAARMMSMGTPADEVKKSLNLLNGELELISSINSMNA